MTDDPQFAFNLRLDGRVSIETPDGNSHEGSFQDIQLELPNGDFVTIKIRQPEPHGYGHAWRFIIDGVEAIGASISEVPSIKVPARGGAITPLKPDEDGPRDWKRIKYP